MDGKPHAVRTVVLRRGVDVLEEAHAVGEVGQGVVVSQIGNLFFGPLLRRNVLMDRHRAAVGHRLPADREDAPVLQFADDVARARRMRVGEPLLEILVGVFRAASGLDPRLQDVDQRRARRNLPGLETVHRAVEVIGQRQVLVGAEHADAVRHMGQRGIQQHVGVFEALLVVLARHAAVDAEDRDREDHQRQHRSDEVAHALLDAEQGENFMRRLADHDDQRIALERAERDQPRNAVAEARVGVVPAAGVARIPLEHVDAGQVPAEQRHRRSAGCTHHAVGADDADMPGRAGVHRVVDARQVGGIERRHDHAAERAVLVGRRGARAGSTICWWCGRSPAC